jgi:predicted transcriptional regulator
MRKLDIHVGGTFADSKRRILDAVARAEHGETLAEDHITFASWDALASVMTAKRFELVRHLHKHPEASIAALARSLKRDYKRVHEDVEALAAAGLVERSARGLRAEYSEIRAQMAV